MGTPEDLARPLSLRSPGSDWPQLIAVSALVALASLPLLWRLCNAGQDALNTDQPKHIELAMEIAQTGNPKLPHPLFFWVVGTITPDHQYATAVYTTTALLTVCVFLTVLITAWILKQTLPSISWCGLTLLCIALTVAMPWPNWWNLPNIYLGQVSPNCWHNSTTTFTMPLAILLYLLCLSTLTRPTVPRMAAVGVVMSVTMLAKPNYVFCLGPIYAVMLAWRWWQELQAKRLTIVDIITQLTAGVLLPLMVFGWQMDRLSQEILEQGSSSIVWDPLHLWKLWSPNITVSILLGIAFPLYVAARYCESAAKDIGFVLCWLVLLVALAMFALFIESGFRKTHGNLWWGILFADHMLFLATATFLLRQPPSWDRIVAWTLLGAHAGMGIYYAARCIKEPQFATLH